MPNFKPKENLKIKILVRKTLFIAQKIPQKVPRFFLPRVLESFGDAWVLISTSNEVRKRVP